MIEGTKNIILLFKVVNVTKLVLNLVIMKDIFNSDCCNCTTKILSIMKR